MPVSPSNKLFTAPVAIVIGSIIISLSILVSGGVVNLKINKNGAQPTPQPQTANNGQQQTTVTINQIKDAFNKSLVKFGDANQKLIFVEISDPSCPYCQVAAGKNPELNKQAGSQFTLVSDGGSYIPPVPEMEKLAKDGKAAFTYIYFPGHGNGEMGAKALYCAFEQNKFWEVHDLLMNSAGYDLLNNKVKNDKTQSQVLADFLQPAIDSNTMKQCLDSGKYDSRLKDDTTVASGLGVNGTPGFFINATKFAGAYSYKDMQPTVDTIVK
jgi:protein-disulfide isomerase